MTADRMAAVAIFASWLHPTPQPADGRAMRSKVEIVQVRVADVESGDVVNKRGPEKTGWIEVERVERLESGDLVVHDTRDTDSFTATGYDLVWLQTVVRLGANSHLVMPV